MKKSIRMLLLMFLFLSCNEQQNKVPSVASMDTSTVIRKDTVVPSNQPSESNVMEDFTTFWKTFREAVLSSDTAQLIGLTAFPLKYRGTLDGDPVIKISKEQFGKVFSLFLKQWNGLDLEGSTELDYIKKTANSNEQSNEKQIRMGNMVFYQKDGKWKLGFLYLNEETIDLLKKKK